MKQLVVFSRHPSHDALRQACLKLPVATSIRFGSSSRGKSKYKINLNPPEAIAISANKLLMKRAFDQAGIKTASWCTLQNAQALPDLKFPIVAKHIYGSRGTGNYKLGKKDFEAWVKDKDLTKYIFEHYYSYNREYRLHVTKKGCFYTCRKMLKQDTPKEQRWFRNNSNSVWIMEENPLFNKPQSWQAIEQDCIKALTTIGLDVAAFDVKVSSENDNEYILLESNSAASFGDVTLQKYIEQIPKMVEEALKG